MLARTGPPLFAHSFFGSSDDVIDELVGGDDIDDAIDEAVIDVCRRLHEATFALAGHLRAFPQTRRDAALKWLKGQRLDPGLLFRSLVWPRARIRAGLARCAPAGCPKGTKKPQKKSDGRFRSLAAPLAKQTI